MLPYIPLIAVADAFNISWRTVGGIRFVKVGRLMLSFCLTRRYRPL